MASIARTMTKLSRRHIRESDNRRCSTVALPTRRHVVYLPLLMIVGIFFLLNLREICSFSFIHKDDILSPEDPVEINLKEAMENGWIPNADIEKYSHKLTKKLGKIYDSNNSTSSFIDDKSYKPLINGYPLMNLQDVNTSVQSSDIMFFWHIPSKSIELCSVNFLLFPLSVPRWLNLYYTTRVHMVL